MYRLNSLNADIQLIVDGAWASEEDLLDSFADFVFVIASGYKLFPLLNYFLRLNLFFSRLYPSTPRMVSPPY